MIDRDIINGIIMNISKIFDQNEENNFTGCLVILDFTMLEGEK